MRPWTVLLEQSDSESEAAGARQRFEALLRGGARSTAASTMPWWPRAWRRRRRCGTCASRSRWRRAEEGPEHQARHLAAGVGHCRLRARTPTPRCRRRSRAVRAGQLRPSGRRQPALQRAGPAGRAGAGVSRSARGTRSIRLVYDAVVARGGSISAEHGIGALKRDGAARTQVTGGAGDDARDQAGARPAGHAQSGPGVVSRGARPQAARGDFYRVTSTRSLLSPSESPNSNCPPAGNAAVGSVALPPCTSSAITERAPPT